MHESSGPVFAAEQVAAAALRITGFLEVAHALIDAGRRIDLGGFDAEVGRLCAHVLELGPTDGRALVPALSALLAEIDGIEAALARASPADAACRDS